VVEASLLSVGSDVGASVVAEVSEGAELVLIDTFWSGRAGRNVRPSWRQAVPMIARTGTMVRRATRRTRAAYAPHPPDTGRAGPWQGNVHRVNVSPLCILTLHAHPDDEASKGAPTLAKYKAEGVRTVLVCCTGGEEGDLQNPALREPGQPFHDLTPEREKELLAELRPHELAKSAEIIGFDEVVMLGYRDSGMKDSPSNDHPDSFHSAPLDEAVGRLVAIIRRTRPQVLITYGDDQRGYPHPDHVKVHDISLPAFERAGDPSWYPEAGEPWQPSKVYYTVWSKARLIAVHEGMLKHRGESPYTDDWLDRPGHDDRITTKVHVGEFLWARSGALRAHATQVDPAEAWWFGLTDEQLAEVYPWEDWILARSLVGDLAANEVEDDLFQGIRTQAQVAS
jgi:mycothiol S-conjugate amidase